MPAEHGNKFSLSFRDEHQNIELTFDGNRGDLGDAILELLMMARVDLDLPRCLAKVVLGCPMSKAWCPSEAIKDAFLGMRRQALKVERAYCSHRRGQAREVREIEERRKERLRLSRIHNEAITGLIDYGLNPQYAESLMKSGLLRIGALTILERDDVVNLCADRRMLRGVESALAKVGLALKAPPVAAPETAERPAAGIPSRNGPAAAITPPDSRA